jgi:hypothetical protein
VRVEQVILAGGIKKNSETTAAAAAEKWEKNATLQTTKLHTDTLTKEKQLLRD